jgi:hypothetical protein
METFAFVEEGKDSAWSNRQWRENLKSSQISANRRSLSARGFSVITPQLCMLSIRSGQQKNTRHDYQGIRQGITGFHTCRGSRSHK